MGGYDLSTDIKMTQKMTTTWQVVKLGDVSQNFDSRRVPLSSMQRINMKGVYPYYGAAGVVDHINDYIYDGLHLLVAEDGTVSAENDRPMLQLADGKFWVNNHAHILRGKDDLETKYLFYALNSISINPYVTGAVQLKVTQENLNSIEIPYPADRVARDGIVSVLAAFDDKIEVNTKASRTLEQMAQAIFKEWFVDFRFPGHKNAEFVDSELGRIPKGWEVKRFGDACRVFGGGTPSTQNADYWGGKIHWATPTDMTALDGEFIDDTERKITEAGLKESAANLLPENSILMTSRATVGLLAINKIPMTTNQGFIALVCGSYPSYTYAFGALKRLIPEVQSLATGSTFPEISRGVFKEMMLVIPSAKINEDYDRIVSPIYDQMYLLSREKKRLVVLRDSLLPKLMSGEIRV